MCTPLPTAQVHFLKHVKHAIGIRNRLFDCFERAAMPGISAAERDRLLSCVAEPPHARCCSPIAVAIRSAPRKLLIAVAVRSAPRKLLMLHRHASRCIACVPQVRRRRRRPHLVRVHDRAARLSARGRVDVGVPGAGPARAGDARRGGRAPDASSDGVLIASAMVAACELRR